MKKTLFLSLFIALLLPLAACQNPGAAPTPAQVAAVLCTPTQTAVGTINALAAQSPSDPTLAKASAALLKIQPTIKAACAAASTVTSTDVQTLITQGLPALGSIIGTLPLSPQQMTALQDGFLAAEAAVNLVDVVVTNIKAAKAAPTTPAAAS